MNKQKNISMGLLVATLIACLTVQSQAHDVAADSVEPASLETNTPPPWDVSAELGFTLTSGNSDTLLLTGRLVGKREWTKSRVELGIAGAYGEDTSVANVQTVRGWGQYDRDITERWYWLGRVDALHDGIADINYRVTLGPGIGYFFIRKELTQLSAEAGVSYVFEEKGGSQSGYFAARIAEGFEHSFNDRVKLVQVFEIFPQVDNVENWFMNFAIGIETSLSQKLSLTATFFDTYNNIPASGRKHNDIKFITGVKYKF